MKKNNGSVMAIQKVDAPLNTKIKQAVDLLDTYPEKALRIFEAMLKKTPSHAPLWMFAGLAHQQMGALSQAEECLNKSLTLSPNNNKALYTKARLLYICERYVDAEIFIRKCMLMLTGKEVRPLESLLAIVLQKLKKYEEAIALYEILIAEEPDKWTYWNQLGLIYQGLADFEKMDKAYLRGQKLSVDNPLAFFNHIASAHYNPASTIESLRALCLQWQSSFKPKSKIVRAKSWDQAVDKKLRIGMISDGFRSHPVGIMIVNGLWHIPKSQMEIYFYSTNLQEDHITQRIKHIAAKWQVINDELTDEALNTVIREDGIDILFDLNGYNANSRILTFQMEPAPIQIKWVGGLISSTGLPAMDYLLSDRIETPEGCDESYSEKLIRMPDDYICFEPPSYLPPVSEAPVIQNGYITFGCFNNAAKINDTLLTQWAVLLSNVPNSRLFLKSFNFSNSRLCERVLVTLEKNGVMRDRVILEGSSPHKDLLASYNKVDIALDPWPYSGGLTTCEAMIMGVPVITLPGPTFAGRHSASHLVNAGMPELVAGNWQQYVDIAVGLTRDINTLSVIRHHLREMLLSSPVCDGKRFARYFSDAMRAVWQRYCEGKAPEALNIDEKDGAYFLDDRQPLVLHHPQVEDTDTHYEHQGRFSFELPGKVMMMDYGGRLARHQQFKTLMAMKGVHAIIMDPLGVVEDKYLPLHRDAIQRIQMHVLGDGASTPLYMCLDPRYSSDLKAIHSDLAVDAWMAQKVLAEVPALSSKLDDIEGMENLEWFVMDNTFNLKNILAHGERTLSKCLFISIWYGFEASHQDQMSFSQICDQLGQLGFVFHTFADIQYTESIVVEGYQPQPSSKMTAAQLLFMPTAKRVTDMTLQQREKLAYILHGCYQLHDVAFQLLRSDSEERAKAYLSHFSSRTPIPQLESEQETEMGISIIPDMPHMSVDEIALFERYVKQATRYFEFGSGGSSKLAARNNLTVNGVESDKNWIDTLFEETGQLCKVSYVDIGPTKEWGHPVDDTYKHKFPLYSEAILQHADSFDLILVDGRFRVACTLNAISHTLATQHDEGQTMIFIHDFWDRQNYHSVLEFLDVVERVDTAGVFKLKNKIDRAKLKQMLNKFKFIAE
ncbi:O-linked N-acetylglucosamine transferase, SPINDLY family protein [Erwinia billingiae]|uniref:O-linked N-acetylglucosamine transferase, SPINDLY family protein n=1 Tax=Erwinia billingiae TaxID=182337 RepID=UPI000D0081BD|nr:tetratricopeptide repeat protein [Erwinia billingiae]PRB60355.1 hypothetical protein CQ001_09350 [Erwinia billingiae]